MGLKEVASDTDTVNTEHSLLYVMSNPTAPIPMLDLSLKDLFTSKLQQFKMPLLEIPGVPWSIVWTRSKVLTGEEHEGAWFHSLRTIQILCTVFPAFNVLVWLGLIFRKDSKSYLFSIFSSSVSLPAHEVMCTTT